MNDDTERTPLSHDAKNLVGSYTRLLDAFGFWRFDLGTMPSELRLGRQVVSWGESTFIQDGLNQVNHFDVSGAARAGRGAEGGAAAGRHGGVQLAAHQER